MKFKQALLEEESTMDVPSTPPATEIPVSSVPKRSLTVIVKKSMWDKDGEKREVPFEDLYGDTWIDTDSKTGKKELMMRNTSITFYPEEEAKIGKVWVGLERKSWDEKPYRMKVEILEREDGSDWYKKNVFAAGPSDTYGQDPKHPEWSKD